MFGFELGREYKLSIAEILAVFGFVQVIFADEKILIIDGISSEIILKKASKLGGTIKIFEIQANFPSNTKIGDIGSTLKDFLLSKRDGKLSYGVSIYGKSPIDHKKFLMNLKQAFKEEGVNSRFINQDFKNLSSAQIIGEKLVKRETDISLVYSEEKVYLGKTLWIQDIEAYGKRDYGKVRDIETIGMLPPKLAQMVINLALDTKHNQKNTSTIYDPFVGLATVLIESLHMGNTSVFGSDYNSEMVASSVKNISDTRSELGVTAGDTDIVELDAKMIQNSSILKKYKIDAIVTEGYLGKLFTGKTLSIEGIQEERKHLSELYTQFFLGLQKVSFSGTIVISFPFWEVEKKYYYFQEIYEILEKYCSIEALLPTQVSFKATKVGSLTYKRPNQIVGREIFKLRMK